MDNSLMKEEDLEDLGLGKNKEYKRVESAEGQKERNGFVAGTGVRPSEKFMFRR
jgi:hypothetical protein